MQMDKSAWHPNNASWEIDESFELGPNVTTERALHSQKQISPSVSTRDGTTIEQSDEQCEKVLSGRAESSEPYSNAIAEKEEAYHI
jgi:hypothetical protein